MRSVSAWLRGAAVLSAAAVSSFGCSTTRTEVRTPEAPIVATDAPPAPSPAERSGVRRGTEAPEGYAAVSRAFPTGDEATSALLVEKVAPVEVMLGAPYSYEIRVTNLTSHHLEEVTVTDSLSKGFEFHGAEPEPDSLEEGVARWFVGDLGPGETRVIRVTGSAHGVDMVKTCAEVSYADKLCIATRFVEPKLLLEKSGPSEVLVCDPIVYTIRVSNAGTGVARNVEVRDRLPDGLVTEDGRTEAVFKVEELAAGETASFEVRARARGRGEFENQARAKAEGGLEATSPAVTTVVRKPDLEIQVTCPEKRFGGQQIEYGLAVTNTGDAACRETVLEATLPAGTTFVNATNGGRLAGDRVVWTLGSIAPEASRDVAFRVTADTLGDKTVRATASCVCVEPVTAECTTSVLGIPAVLLEVVDLEDPIPVGETETYVITVTNQGSAADTNIRIVCELEDEMEFVSADGATPGRHAGGVVTFEPLPTLAPKAQATWRVRVKAIAAGDVRFAVRMETDELGRSVDETEATHFYE